MTTRQILSIAVDDGCDIPARELAGLVHQMIPGSHTLENIEIDAEVTDFEWDDDQHPLPLGKAAARELMDGSGRLTVVLAVDKESYFDHHGYSTTEGADTHEDLVHNTVFDFGVPHDCEIQVLAVQGDDFIVSYTTRISEFL